MATSNSQRVIAFMLALLFLLTSVGAAGYVIWEIRRSTIVDETPIANNADQQTQDQTCGQASVPAVEPRAIPSETTAQTPVNELQTVDIKVGEGETVQPGDCVIALYYGTLASTGAKFDGNYETGQPLEFPLNGVIQGWSQGIPGMNVGGIRRLVIPASLAYGEQDSASIPANSDLVFEVEIIGTRRNTQ